MSNRGLSKNISEKDFCLSLTAVTLRINNTFETQIVFNNAVILCREFLEAVIAHYNKKLIISSGYRCTKLNANPRIGGATNSAHRFGNAADINVTGISTKQLFNDIISGRIKLLDGRPLKVLVDQCIYEEKNGTKWVHIQRAGKPRGQFMYSPNGKTYKNVVNPLQ